ncbi:MAG: hypothetical protein CFE24_07560 [Flavobacterium sp. BFFFF2]|nr:MAG: hypothetical protein CFE24_07560 [Flavobacterium sp. BFFFF2]
MATSAVKKVRALPALLSFSLFNGVNICFLKVIKNQLFYWSLQMQTFCKCWFHYKVQYIIWVAIWNKNPHFSLQSKKFKPLPKKRG